MRFGVNNRITSKLNRKGNTMNVRTLCLAILHIEDATGYEIKKASTEGLFQHFVDASYGSIYPALAKLEKDAMVTCHAETQIGKPDRKVYSITQMGRAEFIKSINVIPQPDKFKSEFLLLAINADLASPQIVEAAIEAQIAYHKNELEMMHEALAECEQPALLWTVEYGIKTIQAQQDYLEENKDKLLALAGQSLIAQAAE